MISFVAERKWAWMELSGIGFKRGLEMLELLPMGEWLLFRINGGSVLSASAAGFQLGNQQQLGSEFCNRLGMCVCLIVE